MARSMMGRRPSGVARLETWFSARMAGLSTNSPAFASTENGIPGGKPRVSRRRVSIQRRDVSPLRPRGVNASNFMGRSRALMMNADYPSILRRNSNASCWKWSFFPRREAPGESNSEFSPPGRAPLRRVGPRCGRVDDSVGRPGGPRPPPCRTGIHRQCAAGRPRPSISANCGW